MSLTIFSDLQHHINEHRRRERRGDSKSWTQSYSRDMAWLVNDLRDDTHDGFDSTISMKADVLEAVS